MAVAPRDLAAEHLPVVAVVDTGVALNHRLLERFRRGTFVHPQSAGLLGDHGTFVASRVVFGDPQSPLDPPTPTPDCGFVNVVVGRDHRSIEGKAVVSAVETVAANFPDVRVFNLSFGDAVAVDLRDPVNRAERLFLTQDLDNLVFARDLVVVVAAGNSEPGIVPRHPYPDHWQDPQWGLGHWAVGFNTLKCGSFVESWTLVGGLADVPYAPSPFSRVGPGLADTPSPDVSAHGGNCDSNYRPVSGHGVFGLTASGYWEDRSGTSYSAPLVSRECAHALAILQQVCPPRTQPFGTTVKALLALTAEPPMLPDSVQGRCVPCVGTWEGLATPPAGAVRRPGRVVGREYSPKGLTLPA